MCLEFPPLIPIFGFTFCCVKHLSQPDLLATCGLVVQINNKYVFSSQVAQYFSSIKLAVYVYDPQLYSLDRLSYMYNCLPPGPLNR